MYVLLLLGHGAGGLDRKSLPRVWLSYSWVTQQTQVGRSSSLPSNPVPKCAKQQQQAAAGPYLSRCNKRAPDEQSTDSKRTTRLRNISGFKSFFALTCTGTLPFKLLCYIQPTQPRRTHCILSTYLLREDNTHPQLDSVGFTSSPVCQSQSPE
jgi:hypothetical protein